MRFIEADAVHRLLDFPSLVEALEAGHRGPPPAVDRLLITQPSARGEDSLLMLPAWDRGRDIGVKLATVFPGNVARADATPNIHAAYVLFDGSDGRPRALIDGTALTYWKTAADSALGTRLLAAPEPETLLMVGAGALAPYMVEAHRAVRPSIHHLLVWNRTADRARALAERFKSRGMMAEAVQDLEAAVPRADLICCATAAHEPLIAGAWLKPGAHLDLVGGFTPAMREVNDAAAQRARIFVDSRWDTLGEVGDIEGPLASGSIAEADILADLYELCGGRYSVRRAPEDITFFKNGGGGHLDLMTARFLLARAEAT